MNTPHVLILPLVKSLRFPALLCLFAVHCFQSSTEAQIPGEGAELGRGLWRTQAEGPVPYQVPEQEAIVQVMQRVGFYIDENCPIRWVDLDTKQPIEVGSFDVSNPGLEYGLFPLISYEWGVTYAACLRVWEVTEDPFFYGYVRDRFETIEALGSYYLTKAPEDRPKRFVGGRLLKPYSLDACGAMTAALIKGKTAGIGDQLEIFINPSVRYISEEQKRLDDGTLARDRPLPDSLWLDDLYMSVPALAQMGRLTGETKYFDDACRQIIQMNARMFLPELGLYRHGWVQAMDPHPTFPWARANGWTIMATTELLSVLPEDHAQYQAILNLYHDHLQGIVSYQGINGFWHQLLDRPATYEETSATAMFVFSIARGINRGWLDASAYGASALLGWNAVTTQIDESGAVHGTCVGTGIGWDAAFYTLRPTSPYAAHGYGPLLLAGAEVLEMLRKLGDEVSFHDGGIHVGDTPDLGF